MTIFGTAPAGHSRTTISAAVLGAWMAAGATFGTFAAFPARAGDDAAMEQLRREVQDEMSRVRALQKSVEDQERRIEGDRRALQSQQERLEALQRKLGGAPTEQPGRTAAQAATDAGAGQAAQPTGPVGQAPEPPAKPPEVATIFQQPGVLTPKGSVVIEPSIQYDYSSNSQVTIVGYSIIPALNIGFFDINRVNTSTWTTAITGRYGLTNRMEVEARVPFVSTRNDTITNPVGGGSAAAAEYGASGSGLGDVEATGRYQINDGGFDRPYFVGTLRVKSRTGQDQFSVESFHPFSGLVLNKRLPTGSGFWGIQPGLTVLFPSDPAVFFGSVSYMYSLSRDIHDPALGIDGRVNPGNIFGFNFGFGLGLNDRASVSLGYDHNYVQRPTLDGTPFPLSLSAQIGTLLLGYSYKLTPKTTMNLSLGIGATKDAPAVQLRLRLPVSL